MIAQEHNGWTHCTRCRKHTNKVFVYQQGVALCVRCNKTPEMLNTPNNPYPAVVVDRQHVDKCVAEYEDATKKGVKAARRKAWRERRKEQKGGKPTTKALVAGIFQRWGTDCVEHLSPEALAMTYEERYESGNLTADEMAAA